MILEVMEEQNGMVSVFLFDSICLITKFFPCMRVYCTWVLLPFSLCRPILCIST